MKCRSCGVETEFILTESADDYQDGYVICPLCKEVIASFVYSLDDVDDIYLTDDELDWRERM